jgi:hypothetical protein
MLDKWRTAVGTLCGVGAAAVWAVSLAVHQPFMQPHGSWTDPSTGVSYPATGSNNTYWPRELRQLAILLAGLSVILICRAHRRGVLVAVGGVACWLGVDLLLDRADVHGTVTALALACGGAVAFVVLAAAARWLSTADAGSAVLAHFAATLAAVLGALTLIVTTPWDEPVTEPRLVLAENSLSLLKAGLVVMFVAVALGTVPLRRIARVAVLAGLAALAAWPATAMYGPLGALGLVGLPIAAALAVAAVRDVTLPRLLGTAVLGVIVLVPGAVVLYFVGTWVGGAMTSLAGNPAINSADSDLSLAFVALVLGSVLAAVNWAMTREATARSPVMMPADDATATG